MAAPHWTTRLRLRAFTQKVNAVRARRPHRPKRPHKPERMRSFGVAKKRYLFFVPLLIAMIAVSVFLRDPGRVIARFRPSSVTMVNPLMGWAVDAAVDPETVEIEHSLVYARLTWRDFEKEPGVYDFDAFERANQLEHWWRAGKRLVMRFVLDAPGEADHCDIPDWLVQEMGEEAGTPYENELGRGFSPNYTNMYLMERHQAAVAALGARYDNHAGVAYIEVGSLGHDGSWTVSGVPGDRGLPPSADLRAWIWAYTSAFPNTTLLAPAPYQPVRLTGLGLFNDALGDTEATWRWLDIIEYGDYDSVIGAELRPMPGFYLTAPSGARLARGISQRRLFTRELNALIRQLRFSHTTYASGITASGLTEDMLDGLTVAQANMGYRLWVREASWPSWVRARQRLSVELDVRNDGAQAFPQKWPVELSLFRDGELTYRQLTSLDPRSFGPGAARVTARIEIPDIESGEYDIGIAILDPFTGQPAVELAMNSAQVGQRALLGRVTVIGNR